MKVRLPKNWKEKDPQEFYEGYAEVLPNGQLKIKWDGIEGHFICDKKSVIIDEVQPDFVVEALQLLRTLSLSQIRQQLTEDQSTKIGSVSRFEIVRSFLEAAAKKPKNPTSVSDEG